MGSGTKKLTYKAAGVDTHEASALVGDIAALVRSTQKHRKLANAFGLFAAAYDLVEYKHPVIVTGADGVGTKLEVLLEHDQSNLPGNLKEIASALDVFQGAADAKARQMPSWSQSASETFGQERKVLSLGNRVRSGPKKWVWSAVGGFMVIAIKNKIFYASKSSERMSYIEPKLEEPFWEGASLGN